MRLAPLYHSVENHAIGEVFAVPGEQKTYGIRRGIRDVFRIGLSFLRNQTVCHKACNQSLGALDKGDCVNTFECCHPLSGRIFSSVA